MNRWLRPARRLRRFLEAIHPGWRLLRHIENRSEQLLEELHALRLAYAASELQEERDRRVAAEGAHSLHRFEFQACSQNGEDGVLQEIFRRLSISTGTFVEIGAGDGKENNTSFLASLGWRGWWIDNSPAALKTVGESQMAGAINVTIATVTPHNVNTLLVDAGVPESIDMLSLDIDYSTSHVWSAIQAIRPKVVVIEYNPHFPPPLRWESVPDPENRCWTDGIDYGASLVRLCEIAGEKGLTLVHCETCGANAFFVRDDLVGDSFPGPNTAERHYERALYRYISRQGHSASLARASAGSGAG